MIIAFNKETAKSVAFQYISSIGCNLDDQDSCLLLKRLSLIIGLNTSLDFKVTVLADYFESAYSLLSANYLSTSSSKLPSSDDWHNGVIRQWIELFSITQSLSISPASGFLEFLESVELSIETLPSASILSADNGKALIL